MAAVLQGNLTHQKQPPPLGSPYVLRLLAYGYCTAAVLVLMRVYLWMQVKARKSEAGAKPHHSFESSVNSSTVKDVSPLPPPPFLSCAF